MGCNCKGVQKIEKKLKKYGDNVDIIKEESKITLWSVLQNLFRIFIKFIGTLILGTLVCIVIFPVFIFLLIWNSFSENKKGIKLPIYWFKKHRKYADNIK